MGEFAPEATPSPPPLVASDSEVRVGRIAKQQVTMGGFAPKATPSPPPPMASNSEIRMMMMVMTMMLPMMMMMAMLALLMRCLLDTLTLCHS